MKTCRVWLLISLLMGLAGNFYAQQNLVPNPSFEIYDTCPDNPSQIYRAIPWIHPTTGTSDYYNSCAPLVSHFSVPLNNFGSQYARTGNGYAGMFGRLGGYVEYIQVQLTDNLQEGKKYCVSFYVSLADTCAYSIYDIGAYISIAAPTSVNYAPLPFIPQIKNPINNFLNYTDWMQVSDTFMATGGERYITIGNFNSGSSDTLLLNSDSLTHPRYFTYLYVDDVSLTLCEDSIPVFIPNVFTPNGDGVDDFFEISSGLDNIQVSVYDRWGVKVFQSTNADQKWSGNTTSGAKCPDGVYYYIFTGVTSDEKLYSSKGFIQLIR